MAEITVTQISKTGSPDLASAQATAAASGGDQVKFASDLLIVIHNADASGKVVTVAAPSATVGTPDYGDLALSDMTINVAAGETIGFTVPSGYAANGNISWTYDAVTSVTVAVYSLAP